MEGAGFSVLMFQPALDQLAGLRIQHQIRRDHGLLVNDSVNLACMERLGLADIATHDRDFERVPGLRVWAPSDV